MRTLIYSFKNLSLIKNYRALFIFVLLTGCSTIPAAINPVEWYKGARDAISGSDTEKEESNATSPRRARVTKSNDGFAKLSSVPARPKVLSGEERKIISGGLIGDHDATRKYSSENFERQSNAKSSSLSSKMGAGSRAVSSPTSKISKKDMVDGSFLQPKLKQNKNNAYIVPPKPVALSSAQNKTKLMSKARKPLFLSKSQVLAKPKKSKLPAVNPNPPKIGNVPGSEENFLNSQTVVISGSGVQQMNFARTVARAFDRAPPSISNISRVNFSKQLSQDKNQKSYQVATILFKNGSSQVGKRDRRVLRQVIAQYKKVGGTLRIIGHASRRSGTNDPVIHKMTNFQVSAARAERVAQEFVKMGVKANKLSVGSVSDSEPRYYEYMPSGEAGNRRAEIFIDFL
jgi:flagellar motor protein MotB